MVGGGAQGRNQDSNCGRSRGRTLRVKVPNICPQILPQKLKVKLGFDAQALVANRFGPGSLDSGSAGGALSGNIILVQKPRVAGDQASKALQKLVCVGGKQGPPPLRCVSGVFGALIIKRDSKLTRGTQRKI